ncbi:MAG: hypothetical protein HC915_14075 [Anaerolineae bacterium]|nr:hypothetical protein [Anaerolineae bacterium]
MTDQAGRKALVITGASAGVGRNRPCLWGAGRSNRIAGTWPAGLAAAVADVQARGGVASLGLWLVRGQHRPERFGGGWASLWRTSPPVASSERQTS